MIISHKHKFIFIKPEKTAGSSLEIALSKYCGQEDIITTLGEEYIRKNLGYLGPRNYYSNKLDYKNFFKILKHNSKSYLKNKNFIKKFIKFKNQPYYKKFYKSIFYEHINALQIKLNVPENIWANYFKFTIIRNPLEQFLSYYIHINNDKNLIDKNPLQNFAIIKAENFYKRTRNKYYINQELIIDKFIDFSNMESDINYIGKKFNFGNNFYTEFKNLNANTQYKKNIKIGLDNATKKILNRHCKDLKKLYFDISIPKS